MLWNDIVVHMSFSFVSFQISLPDGRLRSVLFILLNALYD